MSRRSSTIVRRLAIGALDRAMLIESAHRNFDDIAGEPRIVQLRAAIGRSDRLGVPHGTNDAQKTMGIIAAVLVAGGIQKDFRVPTWVIACSSTAIGLGTMSGGWRIVRTMGTRLTKLHPRSGFCAETGAAISILFATWLGLPVSSTHAIAGAIAGVGSIQRTRAVRWHLAGGIVAAWILTIPASAI